MLPPISGTPLPSPFASTGAPVGRTSPPPSNRPEGVSTAQFVGTPGGPGEIQQTAQVFPRAQGPDEPFIFSVALELPGPERMFRRQSEAEFFERLRQESRRKAGEGRVFFPESPPLTREPYKRRQFPQMVENVEPGNICHGRLLFEQPNFERQGWDLGILTPLVNVGVFYYDLALMPYHAATRPFEQFDCSAGKCLPGDATPLYLYHEELSVTGLAGQAAVVTGLFFLFP